MGGADEKSGRLEVLIDGTWGAVCDDDASSKIGVMVRNFFFFAIQTLITTEWISAGAPFGKSSVLPAERPTERHLFYITQDGYPLTLSRVTTKAGFHGNGRMSIIL